MKATEQYFPVVLFIMLHIFESEDGNSTCVEYSSDAVNYALQSRESNFCVC